MTAKSLMDMVLAATVLVLISPLLLILGFLVMFSLGRPIIFRQTRPGLDGKLFSMFKFRTMREAHDNAGNSLLDEQRMTRLGSVLRRSSLDELPGLINVVKGDMSLVGPRPLLEEYLPLYTHRQSRRHEVLPGITGWAQVNGRNALTWEEKFELDVWYVDNQSFWLDIKILLMTVLKVLKRADISHEGGVTMPRFTGCKKSRYDI